MPENETHACRDYRVNKYAIKSHNKQTTYSNNVPAIVQSRDRTIKFLRAMIAKQICTVCGQSTSSTPSQSQSQMTQGYVPISPLHTSHLQNKNDKPRPLSLSIEMIAKECKTILEKFHTSSDITSSPVIHEQENELNIMSLLKKIDSYVNNQSLLLQDTSHNLVTAERKLGDIEEKYKRLQEEKKEMEESHKTLVKELSQKNSDLQKDRGLIDSYVNNQSLLLQDTSQNLAIVERKLGDIEEKYKSLQEEKKEMEESHKTLMKELSQKNSDLQKDRGLIHNQLEVEKRKHQEAQEKINGTSSLSHKLSKLEHKNARLKVKLDDTSKMNKELQRAKQELCSLLEKSNIKCAQSENKIKGNLLIISERNEEIEHAKEQINLLKMELTNTRQEQNDDISKMNKELQREKYELCSLLEKSKMTCIQSENKIKGNLLIISRRNEEIKRAKEEINFLQTELANARQEQDEEIDLQGGGAMTQMVLDYKVKMNGGETIMNDNDRVKELASESRRMVEKRVNYYLCERLAMRKNQVHSYGFTLKHKIDQLRISGLPVHLIEAMHRVRDIGNASTHDTRHVTREEVERSFENFTMLEKEFEKCQLRW